MEIRISLPDVLLGGTRVVVMYSVDAQLSRSDLFRLWDPVLQHISDGVVVSDARQPDHPILLVNRAFEKLTGYSAKEVRGRNPRFLQKEDRAQPAIVLLREAIRDHQEVRVVLRNYRKDGRLFWNEMTLAPVTDDGGTVVFFVGVLRDVTLQRQAEKERRRHRRLRASEEQFRQIVEHLDDAVWLLEVEGQRSLYSNAACEQIWGTPPAAPGSDAWLEAIHPQDRERTRSLVFPTSAADDAAPAWDRKVKVEFRVTDAGGTERWMRGRSFPIRDEDQRVVRRVGIVQDITEHRRIQEQLRRTNEALATTVQELAGRNLQMLALNETVDHLQGCATWQEAETALEECVPEIFPQEAGGLYLMSAERQALEPLVVWGTPSPPEQPFPPDRCQALRRRREFWTDSSYPSARCEHFTPKPGISDLCLSLRTQHLTLGLLHLRVAAGDAANESAQDVRSGVLRFAVNAAEQIALTLANIQLRQTLHTQAIQDPLTGLYNRRFFNDALERELRRADRRNLPLALLMIDLDHFKRVNDERGHEAGDRLLQAVGEMLRSEVRAEDVIARYGGEEFVVLLPETDLDSGRVLAERLRKAFKGLEIEHDSDSLGPLTLSVGVAARSLQRATGERIVQAADAALYRAKREGRDRVVTAEEAPETD